MSEIQPFLFPGPQVLVRSHGRFLNICSSSRLVSHRPRSLNVTVTERSQAPFRNL